MSQPTIFSTSDIFQEGNYVKAETILHTALTMAQKINHRDGITYVYTLLASLAYQNVSEKRVNIFFPS